MGHEDVERISPREISEWTDHLRHERGLSPKTVSGKYLAAVKTVFHLARSKFLIERDPAKDVSTKIPPKVKSRSSGFTEEEARQVLSAANRVFEQPSNMAHHNKLACRWVPWICAYSGARAGEITQLRKEDLSVVNGIPQLTITPEAGSVKAGMYRNVPVHPHLQEIGLLDFIRSAKSGYGELAQRDKLNLDIFWLKDDSLEDIDSLPEPDVLAAEIVENLEAALEQFRGISQEIAPDASYFESDR